MIQSKALYLKYGKKCDLFFFPVAAGLLGAVLISFGVYRFANALVGENLPYASAANLFYVAISLPPVYLWIRACAHAMSIYDNGRAECCKEMYDQIVSDRAVEYKGARWEVVAHEPAAMKLHLERPGALSVIVSIGEIANYRKMP